MYRNVKVDVQKLRSYISFIACDIFDEIEHSKYLVDFEDLDRSYNRCSDLYSDLILFSELGFISSCLVRYFDKKIYDNYRDKGVILCW